jgi:predicted lipoprotein with Yx(FWY)xxD motif
MSRSWTTARLLPALALGLAAACARRNAPADATTTEAGRRASRGQRAADDTAAVAVVAPTPAGPTAVVLKVAAKPGLGMFLTDATGHAVYVFARDKGGKSSCTGDCARAWPPVTGRASVATAATADSSVRADLIGGTARDDGAQQVTYNNMPLYYFSGDQAASDINGADKMAFGSDWYLVTPDGRELRARPMPPENAGQPPR